MGHVKAYELGLLEPVESLIRSIRDKREEEPGTCRRLLIEGAAARLGHVSFGRLLSALEEQVSDGTAAFAWTESDRIASALGEMQMPPPLAVASLMRCDLDGMARRRSGSYLTDFRLSTLLMARLAARVPPPARIVDPAVGTGSFLVAFALEASRQWGRPIREIVSTCLYGADRSAEAIRGAICALAAAGADVSSLELVKAHLRTADSLAQGRELWGDFPQGFDAVVGNPPWEKLKLTRHEYLRGLGIERHYGEPYDSFDGLSPGNERFSRARSSLIGYKRLLRARYPMHGDGEEDLYKFFVELSLALVKPRGGYVSMLVPAGLIRSRGAEALRRYLFSVTEELNFTLFFNRAHFFEIDTRFKFLAMEAKVEPGFHEPIQLCHGTADGCSAFLGGPVALDHATLTASRPDLTIPEVRTEKDWSLFQHVSRAGRPFGSPESLWHPHIVREVDMTRDRGHFADRPGQSMLPIVEGRMIHQHEHNAKAYRGGTGRRAVWVPVAFDYPCEIRPQFWLPEEKLPDAIRARVHRMRIGFCDVTGQTNERTLLASAVAAGVVCGNKVPTITFEDGPDWLPWAWLAYANSFLLDWILRRIVTTTANYFIIRALPLPSLLGSTSRHETLAELARLIACPEHFGDRQATGVSPEQRAEVRAEIEWRVLEAYGLDASVLGVVLSDFPLLDRGEPPLEGERRSTVTADIATLRAMQHLGGTPTLRGRLVSKSELEERLAKALGRGALPFRPSQLATGGRGSGASGREPRRHVPIASLGEGPEIRQQQERSLTLG